MDTVFKKLNYKNHANVFILNAPDSFENNVISVSDTSVVHRTIDSNVKIDFLISFHTKQAEITKLVTQVGHLLDGDAIFWICYPKGTSKKYTCDFNRDSGWEIMGKHGLEGVRMVAIDEDWSALRFRKIEFIKDFTRSETMALSKEGKTRAKK